MEKAAEIKRQKQQRRNKRYGCVATLSRTSRLNYRITYANSIHNTQRPRPRTTFVIAFLESSKVGELTF